MKQQDIAAHLDMSQQAVSALLSELDIDWRNSTLDEVRIAYIRRLREMAAGRSATGGLDLATERAALARSQREKIDMANAVTRKELAPVMLIEEVLAKAAGKVAGVLDAIPGMVRRRLPQLTSNDIGMIRTEVAKARNAVANLSLADLDDDLDDEGAEQGAVTMEGSFDADE